MNAWLDSPEIRKFCKLESEDAQWLEETLIHLGDPFVPGSGY
ncbi:hypothetical protein ACLB1E_05495 [Escherichia coli]